MFRTTTLAAALLFAATPMVLTSCSKSPIQKAISVMDEVVEILNDTTADNVDKQIAKLDALKSDAKKVGEALNKMADKKTDMDDDTKKQLEGIFMYAIKIDQAGNELRKRVGREIASKVQDKTKEVGALLFGM